MNKLRLLSNFLITLLVSTNLYASSPIQRIDIVNMLSNLGGGVTQTPVQVVFSNHESASCYTTILAYNAVLSVFIGAGQPCISPITGMTITPIDQNAAVSTIYLAPSPISISSGYYYTQLSITENAAPTFDPSNGQVLTPGTVTLTTVNHFKTHL